MNRYIEYNDVLRELDNLKLKIIKYQALIDVTRVNMRNSHKFFFPLYESDYQNYKSKYDKYLYRYRIVQDIKHNFWKFISGIRKSEFKDTRKLSELINRLKLVEAVDDLKIQFSDYIISLNNIKIDIERLNAVKNIKPKSS